MNEEPTLEQIYKDIKEFAEKFSEPPILIDVKDDELREGLIKQLSDSGRDLSSIVVHHPRIPGRNFYKEKFNEAKNARVIITESPLDTMKVRGISADIVGIEPIYLDTYSKHIVESNYRSSHGYALEPYYCGIDMAKNRDVHSVVILNRDLELESNSSIINKRDRNKKKRERRARRGK